MDRQHRVTAMDVGTQTDINTSYNNFINSSIVETQNYRTAGIFVFICILCQFVNLFQMLFIILTGIILLSHSLSHTNTHTLGSHT